MAAPKAAEARRGDRPERAMPRRKGLVLNDITTSAGMR